MKKSLIVILIFLILSQTLNAQFTKSNFSIGASVNYITTSRMFLNPKSPDSFLRNTYLEVDGIVSYSFDFRAIIIEDALVVGIGSEYLKKIDEMTSVYAYVNSFPKLITVEDGYTLLPIELTLYYILPFGMERIKMYMGGGAGCYWGKHYRKIGDIETETISSPVEFGMHVCFGSDFFITNYFSLRAEMKFRDPDFVTKNRYTKTETTIGNDRIILFSKEFDSRINIDGINFILGAVIHF
ncbi:MAG: hypothetical protein N3A61_07440 [Ignavibacteria bacterium]|nr:hypothetical protein [Ignavibacteria bacterium]